MSINFPGTIDVFVNPSGTSTLNDPDHALQHSDANDAIEAIEAVIGTTAGTSVLKDFSAGEFPARVNSGGTLTQTLTGGTINATTLGTPTVTGGSFASPTTTGTDAGTATLTNKTLTSPQVGTSINDTNGNEIIKTPATASAVNEITVTNAATTDDPTISSTGGDTNIHLSLDAKGNALVKVKVLRQDQTTNSYTNNSIILIGYKVVNGNSANIIANISFGITFSSAPIIVGSYVGADTNGTSYGGGGQASRAVGSIDTVGTSSARAILRELDGNNFSATDYHYIGWIAIGQLN